MRRRCTRPPASKTVSLPVTELLLNLQRNKIQAFPAPAAVAREPVVRPAKNMMDIRSRADRGRHDHHEGGVGQGRPDTSGRRSSPSRWRRGPRYIPTIRAIETEASRRHGQAGPADPDADAEARRMAADGREVLSEDPRKLVPADLFDEVNRLVLEYALSNGPVHRRT